MQFYFKNIKIKAAVLLFALALMPVVSQAQVLPPSTNVPLDPFSWILLAGGAVIAGKKMYDDRKKN
ncbi:MAG: hypothetical protein KatS3mg031_1874 [Chitinophagales bacterium]|nr:MAG: hypothetical protein KatS3mg031_1874 [Chitinophagales bacterium]